MTAHVEPIEVYIDIPAHTIKTYDGFTVIREVSAWSICWRKDIEEGSTYDLTYCAALKDALENPEVVERLSKAEKYTIKVQHKHAVQYWTLTSEQST